MNNVSPLSRPIMEAQRIRGSTPMARRAMIVWLWSRGLPARTIAQEAKTSITTVYRWIRRWKEVGSIATRYHTGRHRIWSPESNTHDLNIQVTTSAAGVCPSSPYQCCQHQVMRQPLGEEPLHVTSTSNDHSDLYNEISKSPCDVYSESLRKPLFRSEVCPQSNNCACTSDVPMVTGIGQWTNIPGQNSFNCT